MLGITVSDSFNTNRQGKNNIVDKKMVFIAQSV